MTIEEAQKLGYDLVILPRNTNLETNSFVQAMRAIQTPILSFTEEIGRTEVLVIATKRTKTSGTAAAVKAQKQSKTVRQFIKEQ